MITKFTFIKINLVVSIVIEIYLIIYCFNDYFDSKQLHNFTISNIIDNDMNIIPNNDYDIPSIDKIEQSSQNKSLSISLYDNSISTNYYHEKQIELFINTYVEDKLIYFNNYNKFIRKNNHLFLKTNFIYYFSILLYQIYLIIIFM